MFLNLIVKQLYNSYHSNYTIGIVYYKRDAKHQFMCYLCISVYFCRFNDTMSYNCIEVTTLLDYKNIKRSLYCLYLSDKSLFIPILNNRPSLLVLYLHHNKERR